MRGFIVEVMQENSRCGDEGPGLLAVRGGMVEPVRGTVGCIVL